MRAGSVHPQWHLKRDGRKIGGGPRRVEPLPFPPLGSERACRWGPRGLHCGEGTCTRVHRVDGAPACRQKVYFRTVYVTFAIPCLTFPCLYVRSSAQHGILPGPSSHFPCVSGVVGCVPNQDRKVGRQFFFTWCRSMGHTIYAVPFVWAQAMSKRLLGCQDLDLADLVNLRFRFFRPWFQAAGFHRRFLLSPVYLYMHFCYQKPQRSCGFLFFSFVRHPSQCDMQQKGKLYVWKANLSRN